MFVNIGHDNFMNIDKITTILRPDSSPARKIKTNASQSNLLVDATMGKKTRSILVCTSKHVVLSGITTSKIAERCNQMQNGFTKKQKPNEPKKGPSGHITA